MATSASEPTVTPPPVEVLCAACGESLEVEPGLTEFACPYCHMGQTLPHELMPLKRKALPVICSVDLTKIQLPCCSCSVLLNLPYGLSRFACPQCGVELAVNEENLKTHLSGASSEASPSTSSGVRLSPVVDVEPQIQFPPYVEILAAVSRLADEAMKPIRENMEEMTKSHEEIDEKMKEMVEEMKAMHQLLLAHQDNTRVVHPAVFGGHAGEDNTWAVHPVVIGGHAGEDWLQLG